MRRSSLMTVVAIAAATTVAAPAAAADGTPVSFQVTNLHEPFQERLIHGTLFEPACEASTVVLLMHGLSYTRATWNFEGHSVVEPILEAGYAVVTIDRLGYGESTLPDGYNVSSEAHADIARQIVGSLKPDYDHVVLGGHSAGAEATLLSAAMPELQDRYAGTEPDALLALGYHHFPSQQIATDFFTGDFVRAAQDDYEYFLGTPEHRAGMFFTPAADPAVVAADAAAAVLTPSGEIYSIGKQPSRYVMAGITQPVFLQFGDSDRLFEASYIEQEVALFVSAASVTVDVVADAGHTFMLHPTGPAGSKRLADWLVDGSGAASCN